MEQPPASLTQRVRPAAPPGSQSDDAASPNASLHSELSEEVSVLVSVKRRPLADRNNNSSGDSSGHFDPACCQELQKPPPPPPPPPPSSPQLTKKPKQLPHEECNAADKCRTFVGLSQGRRGSLQQQKAAKSSGSVCCFVAPDGEAYSLTDWLRRVKALKNEFGGLQRQPPRLPTEAPSVAAVEAGLRSRAAERSYPVQSPGLGVRNHYCRYQVAGICRLWRRNCPFSHQQQLTTCKFWHSGFCMKGTDCPFLHGYV
ncbi:hypothetical protein BOX15_Mlig021954g3 [Macrostomum lignano]|uniref:C3H1-type domain-containing protein n=1 Tax=Macrostomum lignano TaxID=282301 RepID=A0A267FZ81_9PLAT|nr:hypothetical protein BOX15_Mlig021954g3 [Macrostomum lignano]